MENLIKANQTIAKKALVILIVFTMTFANFALVGVNVVEAAGKLEVQKTINKGENIEFDAYFKDEQEKTHEGKLNASETQKLYLELMVKDKVTISNAKIKIENPNFSIKEDELQENRYVKNVNTQTNEIEVGNISSNNTLLLELPIQLKHEEKVEKDYFNKEMTVTLEGTYGNINQKERALEGKVKIKPEWTSNIDTVLTQSINKYFSLGENGTLLEQNIETQVENNVLPRKTETVEIQAPNIKGENPSNVIVLIDGEKINDENVQYSQETGIVKFSYENQIDEEGKIDWKSEKNVYDVVYQYTNAVPVQKTSVTLSTKTQTNFYTQENTTDKEETREEEIEPIGNIATVQTSLSGDIYKGYLYENEAKEVTYQENNEVTVSYIEGINTLTLDTNNNTYVNQNGGSIVTAGNIRYVQTIINKEELISLLGEEGRLTIRRIATGEEVISIDNETETDEEGNIVINYGQIEKDLKVETTKPIKEGKLNILNTKAISGEIGQSRQAVQSIKSLVEKPIVETDMSKEGATASIELKETTTEAKLEVSRDNLSTITTNQNVEIKAILNSNSANQDLYANPRMIFEFPEDVEELKVNYIDKIYGDEFTEVRPSQAVIDGKQVIIVDLIGEQKAHKEQGIEGTIININADINLNRKATNKIDAVKMTYSNGKAIKYLDGAQIGTTEVPLQIVSQKGLMTTNSIKSLGIETMGEEKSTEKLIEINAPEQAYTVESEIINNDEETLNDVKILGTFGTKAKTQINGEEVENNIDSALLTDLAIDGIDLNKVKIYYSENENATNDLENAENGWQEMLTNPTQVKKYLITITSLEVSEEIKVGYNINVPAGLEYDKQMSQGYTVAYVIGENIKEAQATTIKLKTGQGPKIKANLSARIGSDVLGNNEEVNKNEILRYDIQITNEGDEDIAEVNAMAIIPEGTTSISRQDEEIIVEEGKNKLIAVGELKAKETKTASFEVMVNDTAEAGSEIKTIAAVEYNGIQVQTNEITTKVGQGDGALQVIVVNPDNPSEAIKESDDFRCFMTVRNMTNREISNIETKWKTPKGLEMTLNKLYDDIEGEDTQDIEIDTIKPGESVTIQGNFKSTDTDKDSVEVSGVATIEGQEYRGTSQTILLSHEKGFDFSMTVDVGENAYLKSGDEVTYYIKLKNKSKIDYDTLSIKDTLPEQVTIKDCVLLGENGENIPVATYGNEIDWSLDIGAEESKELMVKTILNYQEGQIEDSAVSNKAELLNGGKTLTDSNNVQIILEAETEEEPKQIGQSEEDYTEENKEDENTEIKTITRKINGIAWIDDNTNGARDDEEATLADIPVKLLNAETNEFAKDENGNEIKTVTDANGFYTLSNVPLGNYVVLFEYDGTLYKLTEYSKDGVDISRNSNAISKTLNIDNQEKLYGITDAIDVTDSNASNVNIGLIRTGKFDLSLNKYISKITVSTADGIESYNYNNETLAKLELSGNKVEGANVIIEYSLVVTNNGEVSGYASKLKDQIPSDLAFSSELNPNWYQEGTALVSDSLQNQVIVPGESKIVKLVLTKTMSQNNTGIVTNVSEIQEAYNNDGTADTNSTPGNGIQTEDDYSSADAIISIKTGGPVVYTTLLIMILIIAIIGSFTIRRQKQLANLENDIFDGLL